MVSALLKTGYAYVFNMRKIAERITSPKLVAEKYGALHKMDSESEFWREFCPPPEAIIANSE